MDKSKYLFLFFVVMSFVGMVMTVADKQFAIRKKQRIPEKMLLLQAFFGGAIGMYITMHFIRHKTQHKKFMIGLPLIIILHIILIVTCVLLF